MYRAGYSGASLGRQPASALHTAPQPRQQLYRLVPVEQDSVTGLPAVEPGQPLYQLAQPPAQPAGLHGMAPGQLISWPGDMNRIVTLQTAGSQSPFVPILPGGRPQLLSAFSTAQRGLADEHRQQQGVMSLVVGHPGQLPLQLQAQGGATSLQSQASVTHYAIHTPQQAQAFFAQQGQVSYPLAFMNPGALLVIFFLVYSFPITSVSCFIFFSLPRPLTR